MNGSKWIWYPGDFEIYHHLVLSCRRQELGTDMPCAWRLARPEASARFHKTFTADSDGSLVIRTRGRGVVRLDSAKLPVNETHFFTAGEHHLVVELYDLDRFPSLYCESNLLASDESWTVDAYDARYVNVACEPAFTSPDDDPSAFPFEYAALSSVATERVGEGVLYDFGKESFGPVTVDIPEGVKILLVYGESRAEALDTGDAIIREYLTAGDEKRRPSRAFRYVFVCGDGAQEVGLSAELEYLPIEDRASFECPDPLINRIWSVCSDTFHLNSREFFLDGIKRDRWVWSGDAYQSYMIARYLYADDSVTRRTIRALLGKPPYKTHINTINDYSAYLIMSVAERHDAGGSLDFTQSVWPAVKELYAFITGRLDDDGLVVKRNADWIFIDWGVLDKEGPHCAEQILLWRTHLSMAQLSDLFGEPDVYTARADELKKKILDLYWDGEKGAFIDSFASGKRFVSKQTNIFAILFDLVDGEIRDSVIKNALLNDALPPVTTPYFKLYELLALCKTGRSKDAFDYVRSYWGGMLREGATSVWEAYDPEKKGAEHYAMYGMAYGKSLCHAWGSGPILLLCRYCAGVEMKPRGAGFTVSPRPDGIGPFRAVVPVGEGSVEIVFDGESFTVTADADGGEFINADGTRAALKAGEKQTFGT